MNDLRTAAQQALEALENGRRVRACEGGTKYQPPLEEAAIAALRSALAQQEQEPVATVAMDVSGAHLSWNGKYLGQKPDTKIAMLLKDLPVGTLLFTAPPRRKWVNLTEEEMKSTCAYTWPYDPYVIARAIEQACKERNT
jgi:hypothetical protein